MFNLRDLPFVSNADDDASVPPDLTTGLIHCYPCEADAIRTDIAPLSTNNLETNLVNFWRCDENSGDIIDSVGTDDMPVTGASVSNLKSGPFSGSRNFSTDGIYADTDTNWDMGNSGAVHGVIWVKLDAVTNRKKIVELGGFGGGSTGWEISRQSTSFVLKFFGVTEGDTDIVIAVSMETEKWWCLQWQYEAAENRVGFQVNDSAMSFATCDDGVVDGTAGTLGLAAEASSETFELAHIAIWSVAQPEAFRTEIYNNGHPGDYSDNASWTRKSGHTITGTPVQATGHVGTNGLEFDGTTEKISNATAYLNYYLDFPAGHSWTVGIWFKITDTIAGLPLIIGNVANIATSTSGWQLTIKELSGGAGNWKPKILMGMDISGTTKGIHMSNGSNVAEDVWTLVIFGLDAEDGELFCRWGIASESNMYDEVSASLTPNLQDHVKQAGAGIHINSTTSGEEWQGLVDEIGIWNRRLTINDMDGLFNSGAGAVLPPV